MPYTSLAENTKQKTHTKFSTIVVEMNKFWKKKDTLKARNTNNKRKGIKI